VGRLALALLLATMTTATAASRVAGKVAAFKTPSGNIICTYTLARNWPAEVECGIYSGLVGARVIPCSPGDPVTDRVALLSHGKASRVLCAGDPGPFSYRADAPVLAYGRTWRGGGLSCGSARTGLTCRSLSGHGFFLSREAWRLY
jgi:hypothetical protein